MVIRGTTLIRSRDEREGHLLPGTARDFSGDALGSDNGALSVAAYRPFGLSGRGSQVHSLAASAPGSHLTPAL